MSNPFAKLFSGASNNDSVIGVDIGTSSVKIVQIKKKAGKAVLETYGSLSLGPYAETDIGRVTNLPEDKIAAAITDLIRESSVTSMNSGVAIPSSASLVSVIEIPATPSSKEIAAIVQTEARKYIPVPITEVSLDWSVIPKREEEPMNDTLAMQSPTANKTEVLIAAIHNDTIAKYQAIVKTANLQTSFYEIEIFSTMRAILGHEMGTVLIVDFGASKVKLSIVDFGVVRQFHVVMRGSQDITNNMATSLQIPFSKAEEMKRTFDMRGSGGDTTTQNVREIVKLSFDFIFSEIKSVVLAYERRYNKAMSKVILVGGGSLIKGFYEEAEKHFQVEVAYGNAFQKVEAPAFLENILAETGPEFAVAVGLALRKLQ
ncbi:MAG: type IV pilus assembly protein PilM [Candidatus Pacebacteria bacterium]|jgi:type IV pilus assembly protein PilM|nr:type IV pilus assembly protein PilM [Candidatus Paceibacterota bacterium]